MSKGLGDAHEVAAAQAHEHPSEPTTLSPQGDHRRPTLSSILDVFASRTAQSLKRENNLEATQRTFDSHDVV